MALTYTPYKGMDIKFQITSAGTSYSYTLSPGCSITRSASKEITVLPIEGGKAVNLMELGRMESDTIRIDAKVSTVVMQTPDGSEASPPYVPIHTLTGYLIAQTNTDKYDAVVWGDQIIGGRIKNIVITQRPGEGNVVDLAINFIVGIAVPGK